MNEAVCISHSTYDFGKDMYPTILPLAIDKRIRYTGLFVMATSLGERRL